MPHVAAGRSQMEVLADGHQHNSIHRGGHAPPVTDSAMNKIPSMRFKLLTAAFSLVVVLGFGLFCRAGTLGPGEITFRIVCFILGLFIVFGGIQGNAQLQVLWGWMLALAVPLQVAILCFGELDGLTKAGLAVSALAAGAGGWLLLGDQDVRAYRRLLHRKSHALHSHS